MTIDEAIKYHLDIADGQDKCADICVSEHAKERISECANNNRQFAKWLIELKEAKRLLRLAVEDIGKTPCNNDVYTPSSCDVCSNKDNCDYTDSFKWRYADEAIKLLKELSRDE